MTASGAASLTKSSTFFFPFSRAFEILPHSFPQRGIFCRKMFIIKINKCNSRIPTKPGPRFRPIQKLDKFQTNIYPETNRNSRFVEYLKNLLIYSRRAGRSPWFRYLCTSGFFKCCEIDFITPIYTYYISISSPWNSFEILSYQG